MKQTDFTPRAAFLDTHLQPDSIGVEVGCDVGAHAQVLLEYCHVAHLSCIDIFEKPWYEGYCHGRLNRWRNRVKIIKSTSHDASFLFKDNSLDFVYIDIAHDETTVRESLEDWWRKLKIGGVMGYRNYSTCRGAIDAWLGSKVFEVCKYHNEIIVWK